MNINKKSLKQHCQNIVDDKIKILQAEISSLKSSLDGPQKSSAGDKHETSKAHLDLEIERAQLSISALQKTNAVLYNVSTSKSNEVCLGCIVKHKQNLYYISVGIGQIKFQDLPIFCISLNAPVVQKFKNLLLKSNEIEVY